MPSHVEFVAAAYALVLGALIAYSLWLRARRARMAQQLREGSGIAGAESSPERGTSV
jgi:hypothetical protein